MGRTAADRLATADIKARADKFGAKRCKHDDHWHASLAERARCFVLQTRAALGEIRGLRLQPRYELRANGVLVGYYTADAEYCELHDGHWRPVVEDVKSAATRRTEAYRLRKRLFEACHSPL